MAVVRELTTKLDFKANLRPLDRTLGKVKRLKNAFKSFILGPVGIIGAAITGAGVAMFGFVKVTADALDRTAKLAKQLSISSDFLQEMSFAADLSGASQEQFGIAVRTISRNLLEANRGMETYKKAFRDIKVTVKNADGSLRSVEEILPEIADAFKNTIPEAEKAGRAAELFGKSGGALLPLLNEGAEGIENMRKEARRLGIVLDAEALKQSEAFNDELTRLQGAMKGLTRTMAAALLPEFRSLVTSLREFVTNNRELIKVKVISFLEKIAFAVGFVEGAFASVSKKLTGFKKDFNDLVDDIEKRGKLQVLFERLGVVEEGKGLGETLKNAFRAEIKDLIPSFSLFGGDSKPAPVAALPGGGNTTSNNITINLTRFSGESDQAFAVRLKRLFAEKLETTTPRP